MKTQTTTIPAFKNESDEADWWASDKGRNFVKQKTAASPIKRIKSEGSPLVTRLNETSSVQIALRLPEADLAEARRIANRKGIGYRTLLKMLLHEGLRKLAAPATLVLDLHVRTPVRSPSLPYMRRGRCGVTGQ